VARATGSADLPLHGGRVPAWLAQRMASLGRVICEAVVHHYGRDELLRRLSHPFWFQSFGAVMGMDWHSSGITTSVVGALKRGLTPLSHELGIHVCGGRGKHSRLTPSELIAIGERTGLDGHDLARSSRLVAKVDSAAVQDGFDLYLHAFIVSDGGAWCVVQQGMSDALRTARRYHWLSEGLSSFVSEPHRAIEGPNRGLILNLTDARADTARSAQVDLIQSGPDKVLGILRREASRARARRASTSAALDLFTDADLSPGNDALPHLHMPAHHDVRASDVLMRRLHGTLAAAADRGPADFAELLLVPGVGARTVASLALVAEVVHGAPSRFSDPARFSIAHGGKDGHPFPVPLRVYDETIRVLKHAVDQAKLGREDKLSAIRRLDLQARALEAGATGPSFEAFVAAERESSAAHGGMSVFGPAPAPPPPHVAPSIPIERAHAATPIRAERKPASDQLRLPGLRRTSERRGPRK
jgi:uncharacterized protein